METLTLNASVRENAGKGVARKLRRSGRMPAVLNRRDSTLALEVDKKPILRLINSHKSLHTLLSLKLDNATGDKERTAIVREYQVHPVSGELIHVDFREIRMDEKIVISVPVEYVGSAVGVKAGGVMQPITHNVKLECLPSDMVHSVKFDVTNVEAGQTVHASELELPKGTELKSRPEAALFAVTISKAAPAEVEAEEAEEEAAAAEEGAAPAAEPEGGEESST